MCAMYMLCKTGTVCLRVSDPNSVFERICVRTIQTHMCHILPGDLVLSLKQVLSVFPIPLLPTLLSGGDMYLNSTYGSTIDPGKQWVVFIDGIFIIINNSPPPPIFTPYHEPIVGVIYHLFRQIIVEIILVIRHPSYTLICQPDIDQIHFKNR